MPNTEQSLPEGAAAAEPPAARASIAELTPGRRSPSRRRSRFGAAFLAVVLFVCGLGLPTRIGTMPYDFVGPLMPPPVPRLSTEDLAKEFPGLFPMRWPVPPLFRSGEMLVRTSIDLRLQASMDAFLKARRPRYGAVAVIAPKTGEILCLASHSEDKRFREENLALLHTFPAASVFKIVTAAGVLSEGTRGRLDQIDFVGSRTAQPADWNMVTTVSRRSHWVTLEEAFAGSINPVFGKLGLFDLGPDGVLRWAEAFGWSHLLTDQVAVKPSEIDVSGDLLATAAAASGYTRLTTLSPLHGAAIAAAIVNDGIFVSPVAITAVTDGYGRNRYQRQSLEGRRMVTPTVAAELRQMMEATIQYGTAQSAFEERDSTLGNIVIGGKTGTLTGDSPAGRSQWLVGWAVDTETGEPLAFAAVTVHGSRRGTDAKQLSRELISSYYGQRARQTPLLAMSDVSPADVQDISSVAFRSHRSQPFALLAGAAASADSDQVSQLASGSSSTAAQARSDAPGSGSSRRDSPKSGSSAQSARSGKASTTKAASSKKRSTKSTTRSKKRSTTRRASKSVTASKASLKTSSSSDSSR